MKKIIIKFYKWLLGNNRTIPENVEWIDTSYKLPDYKALKKEQVEQMVQLMTSNTPANLSRNRALIMVLFDSGCRVDELLNMRLKHLSMEGGNYKVRIEFSKTKPRTLVLPFCKQHMDAWLDIHPLREQPLAQLFPLRYNALGEIVKRAGRVINAKLTPHGLRHASATYWARSLSPYQLNYRMGWSMSSKQASRYIDQEGLDQEKVSEVVRVEKVVGLEIENAELNKRLALLEEQMNRFLKEDKEELKRIIQQVKERRGGAQ